MTKKETESSRLTQTQRTYFIRRIDEIAAHKISKITNRDVGFRGYNDFQHSQHVPKVLETSTDREVVKAVVAGKIKILSKKDIISALKTTLSDQKSPYPHRYSFLNIESLKAFNTVRNEKAEADNEEKKQKVEEVLTVASNIKDTIMLEGHMAAKSIEDFENRKF